ncbi:hypothetical protein [Arsukibacterium sp. UBA3155]|nr:hypothetical protein [Arsukibacterium sp. UBA3155]|tara:strand:+ start:272115 stop:272249 length:135 start_codon:yes stop_codon:yes gene_type:complete
MKTENGKTRVSLAELKKMKGRSDLPRLVEEQKKEKLTPDKAIQK